MAFIVEAVPVETLSLADFQPTISENCYISPTTGDVLMLIGPDTAMLFRKTEALKIVK